MTTVADDNAASGTPGGKIGARLAQYLTQAHVAAKGQTAGIQTQVARVIWDEFFRGTGAELRGTMGDLFATMAQHPDMADELRPLFAFLSRGQGEMASFIGGSITGSVISGGLVDIINDLMAPFGHAIIAGQPNALLSPGEAATALAKHIGIGLDHQTEAAQGGLNSDRFGALVELSYQRPDVNMVLDQLNRKEIGEDSARGALLQLGFREADLDNIIAMRTVLLDPARLADLVTFGVLTEDAATPMAEQAGMPPDRFHLLVEGNGTPPSNVDLAFAFRRGVIDRDRFIRGLTQSSLRNEWIPFVEQMVLAPMSVSDAVESVVQNALTDTQGRDIARQNGLIPEHWDPLVSIAGNPPGVQEMISMWHRGQMTRDELVQGMKESRLKNKYIDRTIAAGETLPPERTITSLVAKGALTPDRGMDLLLKRGYAPDIAQALMDSAHTTKTAREKELTGTEILALYTDRAVSADQAKQMLTDVGYDPDVIGWKLAIADLARQRKFNDAAISRVHGLYLAFRIDLNTASTTLDSLNIPPTERDDLLSLWQLEADVGTKDLTLAQIEAAWKKKAISDQELHDRIRGLGYVEDDTLLLMGTLGVDITGSQGG